MNFQHAKKTPDQVRAIETSFNGDAVILDHRGILYLPDEKLLVVSDLHLEKGAAFARRGQLHPPYDTKATLFKLSHIIADYAPKTIMSLGDSFHDRHGAKLLPINYLDDLKELQKSCDWIWIAGNHDPEPPEHLDGDFVDTCFIGKLTFRHEPEKDALPGEVSGHLHPAACITRRNKTVKRPCFAVDKTRMIMPSFGSTTGGLSLKHKAFDGLFDQTSLYAHVLGKDRIYPIAAANMSG